MKFCGLNVARILRFSTLGLGLLFYSCEKPAIKPIGPAEPSQSAVRFENPVIYSQSKALAGPIKGGSYPKPTSTTEGETFGVFAVVYPVSQSIIEGTAYTWDSKDGWISNEQAEYSAAMDGWKAGYWPKGDQYKLSFGAYSPYSGLTAEDGSIQNASSLSWTNSGLQINGFKMSEVDFTKRGFDLMYSNLIADKSSQEDSSLPYYGIDMAFNHALSSLNFTVSKSDDYEAEVSLLRLRLLDVFTKADFNSNLSPSGANPMWSNHSEVDNILFFYSSEGLVVDEYRTNTETGKQEKVLDPDSALYSYKEVLPIPQNLSGGAKLEISYKIRSHGSDTYVVNTVTKNLSEIMGGIAPSWKIGHAYTYNIIISLTEIKININLTSWTTQDNTADIEV